MHQTTNNLHRRARIIRSLALAVVAVAALLPVGPAAATDADEADPFPLVGEFTFTKADGAPDVSPTWLEIDPVVGLVAAGSSTAYTLDTETLEQTSRIPLPAGFGGPRALDPVDHRLFLGESCFAVSATPQCVATGGSIMGVRLTEPFGTSSKFTFPESALNGVVAGQQQPTLPGQVSALAYDAPRRILYAVTSSRVDPLGSMSDAVVLHALDADALWGTNPAAALLWSYPVRNCLKVAGGDRDTGNFLGVGVTGDFVYFACDNLAAPVQGTQFVPHGAVVVDLAGGGIDDAGRPHGPVGFRTDFFPFRGDLEGGKSGGDRAGERLFVQPAQAGTQVLYVFDARHRAWTGARPLRDGNYWGAVADPATGRVYPIQQTSEVELVDAAQVPVPQGQPQDLIDSVEAGGPINPAFDAAMRRLYLPPRFVLATDSTVEVGSKYRVYQDNTPPPAVPMPVDPDSRTHDIDEADAVAVTHTGGASAYGARATFIGGTGNTVGGRVTDEILPPVAAKIGAGDVYSPIKPAGSDSGLFLGRVIETQLTGAAATASAVGAELTESTESDLKGKYGTLIGPVAGDDGGGAEGLSFDSLLANVGESAVSACDDRGGEPASDDNPGSQVACVQGEQVTADAASSEQLAGSPVKIGFASSDVTVLRDAERGIVSTANAVARGIRVEVPGLGALDIGEVRTRAVSWAHGRPGTAGSTFDVAINAARITDAAGKTLFACGFATTGADDKDGRCDPEQLTRAVNDRFAARLQAQPPRPATDPAVTGSPGGAQALVQEDRYGYWNDSITNGDGRPEVNGLQLVLYADGGKPSRLVVQLASVLAEAQYHIGEPQVEVVLDPASLAIELLDQAGDALAGGMFEVRKVADAGLPAAEPTGDEPASSDEKAEDAPEDETGGATDDGAADDSGTSTAAVAETDDATTDEAADVAGDVLDDPLGTGELIGACVTDDDGTGDCTFEGLEPGAYLVTQTAAPAGFAEAPPFPVLLTPGFASTVSFTNIKAAGTIEISLSDTADPPKPLPGGEFAVLADDGDGLLGAADVELGRCTTGADGTCEAIEAPVGTYVVHQVSAPDGLDPAADVAFAFKEPGQTAALAFVNGLPAQVLGAGTPPPLPSPFTPSTMSSGSVAMTPPSPAPPPVVTSEPIDASAGRSPLARMASLPAQAVGFLTRSPGEAAMFAGVWSLLLAPAYLAARRRKLTLVKEGI